MLARVLSTCDASIEVSSPQNMKFAPTECHLCISFSGKVMPMLAGIWRARAAWITLAHPIDDNRVLELAKHAGRTGQIRRSKAHNIDARRIKDFLDLRYAVDVLDLQNNDHGRICLRNISVGLSPVIRSTPWSKAARSFRRIFAGRYRCAGFREASSPSGPGCSRPPCPEPA